MKKTVLIFILSLAGFNLFSQGYIKVYTDLKEETSQFIVYLNEEAQDSYPSDETEIEGLLPGKYQLTVSFNSDTIADWSKTFKLKKNEHLTFKVEKMNELTKNASKLGRNMKKDSKGDDGLVQYYRLILLREEDKK